MRADLTAGEAAGLQLSPAAVDGMLTHLRTPDARERVGVLIGTCGHALRAIHLLNSTCKRDAFRIETSELVRAARYAERQHQHIVALYHSHPSGELRLSDNDRQALMSSRWPWLLLASQGDELQCRAYSARTCMPLRLLTPSSHIV